MLTVYLFSHLGSGRPEPSQGCQLTCPIRDISQQGFLQGNLGHLQVVQQYLGHHQATLQIGHSQDIHGAGHRQDIQQIGHTQDGLVSGRGQGQVKIMVFLDPLRPNHPLGFQKIRGALRTTERKRTMERPRTLERPKTMERQRTV